MIALKGWVREGLVYALSSDIGTVIITKAGWGKGRRTDAVGAPFCVALPDGMFPEPTQMQSPGVAWRHRKVAPMPSDDLTGTGIFSTSEIQADLPPYVLVAQAETQAFSQAVSKLMTEDGYVPQGGVFVAMAPKGPVFCQAMVLKPK